jgi:hypothetical protein
VEISCRVYKPRRGDAQYYRLFPRRIDLTATVSF